MDETREERDKRLRLQERFDIRYVLSDGEYKLLRAGFIGLCSTILGIFVTGLAYFAFHIGHL